MLLPRLCVKVAMALMSILIFVYGFASEPVLNQTQADTTIRDPLKSGGNGPEMVVIPAGTFLMGCMEENDCPENALPVHEVSITKFALGKYEVTFEEYDRFANATEHRLPQDFGWGRGNQPVLNVSWNDAHKYVAWLSKETGEEYRLPSEAEWEYAARAGSNKAFFFGNEVSKLCEYANHADSSTDFSWRNEACSDGVANQTSKVGRYLANSWGLHDMHGNVWEWVADCWYENYSKAPSDGNAWIPEGCTDRVVRGGSFNGNARFLSSSFRLYTRADYPGHVHGFRVARTIANK
ncbi:MAG: formylglycine-generating enzyme family protein [Gammaproteobacteria bacterium]|nr:formylglycine-generating enzyme family protein [Gammaproteobacteria bacterium]